MSPPPRTVLAIRPAFPADCEPLAAAMREADRAEASAIGWPAEVVRISLALSDWAFVAVEVVPPSEELAAVWGCSAWSDSDPPIGQPWCFTTTTVERHRRQFARESRNWVGFMRRTYPGGLQNWCDARHVEALRWLDWLGFRLDAPAPLPGTGGQPFVRFSWGIR